METSVTRASRVDSTTQQSSSTVSLLDKGVYIHSTNGSSSSSSYSSSSSQVSTKVLSQPTWQSKAEKENLASNCRTPLLTSSQRPDGIIDNGTASNSQIFHETETVFDRKTNTRYKKGKLLGEVILHEQSVWTQFGDLPRIIL
jgi:hypothetical protein